MTSFNTLQPVAAGLCTLLAVALFAGWTAFLAAFLLLPPRLNALINLLAAASPHSCLYYIQRPNPANCASSAAASRSRSRSRELEPYTNRHVPLKDDQEKARCTSGPSLGSSIGDGQDQQRKAEQARSPAGPEVGSEKRPLPGGVHEAIMPRLQFVRRKLWSGQYRPMVRLGCNDRAAAANGAGEQPAASRKYMSLGNYAAADEKGRCNEGCGGDVMTFDECMREYGSVPSLRVLIMVAGTRGDVQPATALGVRLSSHGHRVRLATHVSYRDLVSGAGLEFFPLAGDPRGMMELTVKHRGMLFGDLGDMLWLRRQYAEIMNSCWAACGAETAGQSPRSRPSPHCRVARGGSSTTERGFGTGGVNGDAGDFQPDIIIATAITYGAVHCAEALDVPLHVISTIPWRPTQEICHPWARGFEDTLAGHCSRMAAAALPPPPAWAKDTRVGAAYGKVAARVRAAVVESANWWSSCLLDHTAWLGIADLVWAFRRRLGLPLLSLRNTGFALYDLPTTFTFSPALVAPPRDWGPHVAVSGPLLLPEEHIRGPLLTVAAEAARCAATATVAETAAMTLAKSASQVAEGHDHHATVLIPGSSSPGDHQRDFYAGGAIGWEADGAREGPEAVAADASCIAIARRISTGRATCASATLSEEYVPPLDLVDFLEREPDRKPIYIGFGSTTLADGKALAIAIREAISATGVRAVVSAGEWGCLAPGDCVSVAGGNGRGTGWAPSDIFVVQGISHTWLFPRCAAVIHHGGVGTTVAGLLAGCPTFVAPSFGDLFLWGEQCARAGVGPMPIPIYKLTTLDLQYAIRVLLSEGARDAAKIACGRLRQLDGLAAAVQHIYRGLVIKTF